MLDLLHRGADDFTHFTIPGEQHMLVLICLFLHDTARWQTLLLGCAQHVYHGYIVSSL